MSRYPGNTPHGERPLGGFQPACGLSRTMRAKRHTGSSDQPDSPPHSNPKALETQSCCVFEPAYCVSFLLGHQILGPMSCVSAGISSERTKNVSSSTPNATM